MPKKVFLILILCLSYPAFGQLQPLIDQYHTNGLAINPAYTGSQDALSVGISSRSQWIGFEGAPRTYTFSVHSPLRNRKVNLGLVLLDDRLGSKIETGFLVNYAYRVDLGAGKLSLGLAGGFCSISSDIDAIQFSDPGDNLINETAKRAYLPEFSFGAYYYTDRYYLGFSAPLVSGTDIDDANGKYNLIVQPGKINYLTSAGYIFTISDNIEIFPSLLIKLNPANKAQIDFQNCFILKEKFWLGAGVRSSGSLLALLKLQVNPQLKIAYSYGYELSKLRSYQNGTHEIVLQYSLNYILDVISPRYF